LWDFSDYDSYSTEIVSQDGPVLHWFSEPRHYTRALGDAIVRRILGAGDARFGALLTPENIEAHLADIRERRRLYHEQHPADVRRVANLYDLLTHIPSRTTATELGHQRP
jgi:hypothetical protein